LGPEFYQAMKSLEEAFNQPFFKQNNVTSNILGPNFFDSFKNLSNNTKKTSDTNLEKPKKTNK
jgi:hypothetical protein